MNLYGKRLFNWKGFYCLTSILFLWGIGLWVEHPAMVASLGWLAKGEGEIPESTTKEDVAKKSRLRRLVSPSDFVEIPEPECVKLPRFGNTSICIKPLNKDKFVSAGIKRGGWESDIVVRVMEALERHPGAALLDIGCNLGMFTVVAASLGREVVAVDAVGHNLALLHRSLQLGNTTGKVTILQNAVSAEHTTLYPVNRDPTNEGGTHMLTSQQLEANHLTTDLAPVESVTMAEILATIATTTVIVKMDIEGYECQALQEEVLLGRTGKSIPYIFLEWMQLKPTMEQRTCPEYHQWKHLFWAGGYSPHHPGTLKALGFAEVEGANDILWVHLSAKLP